MQYITMVASQEVSVAPAMPMKQKVIVGFKSLLQSAKQLAISSDGSSPGPPPIGGLFCKTDPAVDGEECLHDCDSCTAHYPRGFKIEEAGLLYGHIKGWSTHVLVATGKSDWVRNVTDEKGSVMQAIGNAAKPSNGVSLGPKANSEVVRGLKY